MARPPPHKDHARRKGPLERLNLAQVTVLERHLPTLTTDQARERAGRGHQIGRAVRRSRCCLRRTFFNLPRYLEESSIESPMLMERSRAVYDDPILDRMLSLAKLPVAEQLNWIQWASSKLLTRKRDLEAELGEANDRFVELAFDAERIVIEVRLQGLQRLYDHILAQPDRPSAKRQGYGR